MFVLVLLIYVIIVVMFFELLADTIRNALAVARQIRNLKLKNNYDLHRVSKIVIKKEDRTIIISFHNIFRNAIELIVIKYNSIS